MMDAARKFSVEDARHLAALAANAPLQNLRHAAEVSALLARFDAFVKAAFVPEAATPAEAQE